MYFVNTFDVCVKHYSKSFQNWKFTYIYVQHNLGICAILELHERSQDCAITPHNLTIVQKVIAQSWDCAGMCYYLCAIAIDS